MAVTEFSKLLALDLTSARHVIISQPFAFSAISKTGVTNGMPTSDHEALL